MRWSSLRGAPLLVLMFGCGVGCGENLVGSPPAGFELTRPEGTCGAGYPGEPYGSSEGQILPCMEFEGYFTDRPRPGVVDLEHRAFTFEDIRSLPGYTHMLVTVAAEWCKPCREEAELLPSLFDSWAQRGGYVLGIINQDLRYNAADRQAVDRWGGRYETNYSLAHDPNRWVADYLNPSTVPLNVVVELSTMRVLRARIGEDPDTFRFFESQLRAR